MRVLEPRHLGQKKSKKISRKREKVLLLTLLFAALISAGAVYWYGRQPEMPFLNYATEKNTEEKPREPKAEPERPQQLKNFTGEEFKSLYQSMVYPNTQPILPTDPPEITGNLAADARIREIAESRGYKLSAMPMGAIIKISEKYLDGDDLLQPLAAESWEALKKAAAKAGRPLVITSAYRSPEVQRELFLGQLYARGTLAASIARGFGGEAINATLATTAPPGYSRHHTGYTIDLWCEDGSRDFLGSTCYRWLSANNYKVAKLNEWVPSYPEGTNMQGPEPESWEYVWVGRDVLYE